MTFYTQSGNGSAIPCNTFSNEKEIAEEEKFMNDLRLAAYQLRKKRKHLRIMWRAQ